MRVPASRDGWPIDPDMLAGQRTGRGNGLIDPSRKRVEVVVAGAADDAGMICVTRMQAPKVPPVEG